jgi:hypothetical protein
MASKSLQLMKMNGWRSAPRARILNESLPSSTLERAKGVGMLCQNLRIDSKVDAVVLRRKKSVCLVMMARLSQVKNTLTKFQMPPVPPRWANLQACAAGAYPKFQMTRA